LEFNKENKTMSNYKILKQFIASPQDGDPSWAQRNVWVQAKDENDEFIIINEKQNAEDKCNELINNDDSGRLYKAVKE